MENKKHAFNKNILIAVDGSENSRRAVAYVGWLLGSLSGFHITLLHVIPDPEEDFFSSEAEKNNWLEGYCINEAKQHLSRIGFDLKLFRTAILKEKTSRADGLLAEAQAMGAGTIIIARRGATTIEAFAMGRVTRKILYMAFNNTIWIV